MEINQIEFCSFAGFHSLYYTVNGKQQVAALSMSKEMLPELLVEAKVISATDGSNVMLSIIDEGENWMPLEEFLPLMSNTSWKDVATYIENSKK